MTSAFFEVRSWLWKPKKDENLPLTLFFYADSELRGISRELDSFDGLKDPLRCERLLESLREHQHKLLVVVEKILAELNDVRSSREYRLKFPEDVQEDLKGFYAPLWFGAECLAAGSVIENRESESVLLRPLASNLVKTIAEMRAAVRAQAIRDPTYYGAEMCSSLARFDYSWTEFEAQYVRCLVPVKTEQEFTEQQNVVVLFSESLQRALHLNLVSQDMIDDYEPQLMFTIPRLALCYGIHHCPGTFLSPQGSVPFLFKKHLLQIRQISTKLLTLSASGVLKLERRLANLLDSNLNQSFQPDACFAGACQSSSKTPEFSEEVAANDSSLAPLEDALIRDLFTCISQVADMLQSDKHTKDFRHILKTVFAMYQVSPCSQPTPPASSSTLCRTLLEASHAVSATVQEGAEAGPVWVADAARSGCCSCEAAFTVLRRRHHCRNCGEIFCARCSSQTAPIPKYGITHPVRVCNRCYVFDLDSFF
eukprot:Sdes_comp15496_c0_seq1m4421